MTKFLIKFLIFISIPAALVVHTAYSLIIEPIDQEGFRAWENLSVLEKNEILSGPFYPNMFLQRIEYGDQPKPAGFEAPKDVIWETDRYGYRKKQTNNEDVDIVIIGDSYVAGTTLTQIDMFTEKLEKILGKGTYPYAPSHINLFINDKRFISHPPRIVVLVMAEKLFQDIPEIDTQLKPNTLSLLSSDSVKFRDNVQKVAIIYDRLKKRYFFDYMRVKFYELLGQLKISTVETLPVKNQSTVGYNMATDRSMVFSVQADDYFIPLSDKQIDFHIWKMKGYRDYLKVRGIRFIVAVIPNKENIYYKIMKGDRRKPDFLKRFNERARKEGLEVADLQGAFDRSYNISPKDLLFQIDDSHWNPRGVEIAAREIVKVILK